MVYTDANIFIRFIVNDNEENINTEYQSADRENG